MEGKYKLFWGDAHLNVHGKDMIFPALTPERMRRTLEVAKEHLDFLPIAYYPFKWYKKKGFIIESCGQRRRFLKDWKIVQEAIAKANQPGKFVTFLGYEWHGNRRIYGDHNVYYLNDYEPLDAAETLPELYRNLQRTEAIAVPHHTAYEVGNRGKDWNLHDDELSPLAEIYSGHGSSEGCNTPFTLNRNMSMSPRVAGGTVQEGLNRGYRLGIIASGDNHRDYAGVWGNGLMAVYAEELTRESLWKAFKERRVYGVTGDRIRLSFSINGHFMGESFASAENPSIESEVMGSNAIDRVEIIGNGRVLHTYCHSASWQIPRTDEPVQAKLRIECGWGPSSIYPPLKSETSKVWKGSLGVEEGKIVSVEPCFTNFGQSIGRISGNSCEWFSLRNRDQFKE